MGLNLHVTPRARQDLDEIWTSSVNRWGLVQTESYFAEMRLTLEKLALNPRLARPKSYVRPGLFSYPSGSHEIFFRVRGDALEVVRILHSRMDFKRHL